MPPPKDPEKRLKYKEKQRRIALEKGYGKWSKGTKRSAMAIEKFKASISKTYSDPTRRAKLSSIAKSKGYGKWMLGRKGTPKQIESARSRKGKTYLEIYGAERAIVEAHRRKNSNRIRHMNGQRLADTRPQHNGSFEYTEWRTKVFKRDKYVCVECGEGGYLHAHHINSWAGYPDLRYCVGNGITLCEACHKFIHSKQGLRKRLMYWLRFNKLFNKKIALIGALFLSQVALAQESPEQLCHNGHPAKRSEHVTYGGLLSHKGMVRDHIIPLCACGLACDTASNIQYQRCDKFIRGPHGSICILGPARDKDHLEWHKCEYMCQKKETQPDVMQYFSSGAWKADMPPEEKE